MKKQILSIVLACAGALVFAGCATTSAPKPATANNKLDAPVPTGLETNLVTLNILSGMSSANIPNRASVEHPRRPYEVSPYVFKDIASKMKLDGIFKVAPKGGGVWPPDMAGIGPFFLLKSQGCYYLLTPANFARAFGPITKVAEVLPYIKNYEILFGDKFGTVITDEFKSDGDNKDAPPETTKIEVVKDGFDVRLVMYHYLHNRLYYAKTMKLNRNGTIQVIDTKTLKYLGRGGALVF